MPIKVIKADGRPQAFDPEKVKVSLIRSGASQESIDQILVSLTGKLHDGITTKEIYRLVYEKLRQLQAGSSVKYCLKDSLMGLGPSGYPFENFIARLLTAMGYRVQTQVIVKGACIDHEVDVVAEKEGEHILVECKYHNQPGGRCRSKTALYVQARFEDIMDYHRQHPETGKTFHQIMLATNTKLTTNTIKYGQCKGMGLLAWHYPEKGSLEQLVEKHQLYPLACLSFLDAHQKQLLHQDGIVLCRDLMEANDQRLKKLTFNSDTIKQIRLGLKNLL